MFAKAVDLRKEGVGLGNAEIGFEGGADGLGPGGKEWAEGGEGGGLGTDGVEEPPEGKVLADDGGGAADQGGQPQGGVDFGGEGKGGLDIDQTAFKQGEEECVLAGEMGVQQAGSEAGFGGDGFDGSAREAVAGEQEEGGIEEAGAGGGTEGLVLGRGAGHHISID